MTADMHLTLEASKANDALNAISYRGYDIPAAVTQAHACQRELDTIVNSQPSLDALATDPRKLQASLTRIVAQGREHHDMQDAAEAARAPLATRVLEATRAAVPGWIKCLQSDFDTSWQDFRTAWVVAPIALDGYSTDEQAAAHAQLLRATAQLDQILSIRQILGTLLHEEGADNRNALLATELPDPPQRADAIEQAWLPLGHLLDTWAGGHVQLTTGTRPPAAGLEKWDALASVDGLCVGLADVPSLEQRSHKRDAWSTAMTTVRSLGGVRASENLLWRELAG